MFVKNIATTISVVLKKTDNFANYTLADFDLIIERPDKTVAYDDNISNLPGVQYPTVVTATTDGEITFNFTPDAKGMHKITISKGIADAYTILGILHCSVIEPTAIATLTAKLP